MFEFEHRFSVCKAAAAGPSGRRVAQVGGARSPATHLVVAAQLATRIGDSRVDRVVWVANMVAERQWWAARGAGLGFCLLVAVLSCSSPTRSSDAGGASTESHAGMSGTAATDGGSGAVSGQASLGGDGGTGALLGCQADRDPNPVVLPPSQRNADSIARAAAVVAACWPDDGPDRNATHMWNPRAAEGIFFERFVLQAECLAHANCGCAAIEHCLGVTIAPAPQCPATCAGSRFSTCGPADGVPAGSALTIDCSAVGLTCDPAAGCAAGPAQSCDPATFYARCDGQQGTPEYCVKGFAEFGTKCGDLGLYCNRGACVGSLNDFGEGCANTSTYQPGDINVIPDGCLQPDELYACVNGQTTGVNCPSFGAGFKCQVIGQGYFCGLASQCEAATDYAPSHLNPPTCDGSSVVYCNAGRTERIDCLELGFTGCDFNASAGHYGCVSGIPL